MIQKQQRQAEGSAAEGLDDRTEQFHIITSLLASLHIFLELAGIV